MLSPNDTHIAKFTLTSMISMLKDGIWTQERFDIELKSYLQFLINKGLEVDEMKNLLKDVGINVKINIREI
jgi:hypothetical protein